MRRRACRGLIGALCALPLGTGAAHADSATSTNWAGYAVHRSGVHFNQVYAKWVEPSASCAGSQPTYSAMWVGLGGYATDAQALEQIGTETDCTSRGRVATSAWYEMVPAASRNLSLTIRTGDTIAAEVTVSGTLTTLTLSDHTRHESVTRHVRTAQLDTSSAEWILEAPSACTDSGACETLPLTDFGSAAFSSAEVRASTGATGGVSSRSWGATEIRLITGGGGRRQYVDYQGVGAAVGTATPSSLAGSGHAFSLAFAAAAPNGGGGPPSAASARVADATRLVHPLR